MICACGCRFLDRGRAMDGRRAYRCQACGRIWTQGLQGRKRRYSPQRPGNQFSDTGASKRPESGIGRNVGPRVSDNLHKLGEP